MKKKKKVKVYFIKFTTQKEYSASNNRFLSLVKMVSHHFKCKVVKTKKISNLFLRFKIIRGLFIRLRAIQATLEIAKSIDSKNANVLYIFNADPILSVYYWFFAKLNKIKIISERNEFPKEILKNNKLAIFLNKTFVYPWYIKLFDGYSLISDELINFYKKYAGKRCVIKKLPMTVDFSRFTGISKEKNKKYILYTGSLNQKKDGVYFLINEFIKIHAKLGGWKLYITGESDEHSDEFKKKIKNTAVEEKINFLGLVDRNKIPGLMMNASVCVLPRPDSLQARGGFPTKLGEYLASGCPVITTDVGEIPMYLSEKEVYFISKDNIEKDLIKKILEICLNYKSAVKKGFLGKEKAFQEFSLEKNSKHIKELILEVTGLRRT
jgi:glycosyltransferase involved in cell wall biosynthesis